jgi:hypothetical protein
MTITATSDNQIRKSNIRNWTIGLQTFATGSLPRSGLVQRALRNIGPCRSFRLDVRRRDHVVPLVDLFGDELAAAGETTRGVPPRSASRALILGSARPVNTRLPICG